MTLSIRMLLLFAFVVIVACTPKVIKMDSTIKESLTRTHEIAAIHYIPPDFRMPPRSIYASGAIFGGIGGAISTTVAGSQGERIVEEFGLPDPILRIKEEFLAKAQNKFPNLKISQISEPIENDDIPCLKEKFTNRLIFDFQTIQWGVVKHVEGWEYLKPAGSQDRRKAKFFGRARLIDPSKERILWQVICDLEDSNIFTMKDVKYWYPGEDNSLEGLFKVLGFRCVKELVKQFINASPSL